MKMNIQESFVGKTLNRKSSDIVPKKLELDEQSFFSLLSEYTDSLGITNLSNGDIVDTKSESGREFPVVVKKEVKRYLFKPVSGLVGGSFVVSLVVSPYSYFWGKATEIPVFDLDFKVLFYPNNNEIRIGIYVNNYKAKCCRKNGVSYEVVPRHFFRKSDGRFLDKSHDFFSRPQKFFELTKMGVDSDTLGICKNYIKRIADFKVEPEKGVGVLNLSNDSLEDSVIKVQSIFGDELFCLEEKVLESFTKKVSRKNSSDLISDIDYPDGVYILHDTLGVKTVDSWNPKNNNGVVGILVVEGEHKIVVATEDAPEDLSWSNEDRLINQPVDELEDTESDFNGEIYCRRLNSPDFPAAYYCKTYNKGGRSWYLPSTGELWLICRHLEEIQNALETVGGQKLIATWDEGVKPLYWSSTEGSDTYAWQLYLTDRFLGWTYKVSNNNKVRPVSNFNLSELKESFVKKIRKIGTEGIVSDADDKAFNPVMDAKEFINRMKECILSYKQPYVYGKKNPYNLEKFSFEMITSWPNTFKFNDLYSNELLFDVSNSKKPSFRIKLSFFKDNSNNIICYLTVGSIKPNYRERIYEDRLFQYIYDSKKKRISFVENPKGVRFDDKVESIEPTLKNLNFILNDIRFLMDNWKILYKTYLKKNSFETWNEFYKMLPSQNNKGFDFDLKESFAHKISKKTSGSLKGREMFGEMESFGEFDMLFKRFLKKHENQFSSCFMTDYPFKSKMLGRIGYKVVLKKDCPFEDGSDDRTVLRFSLDVFQRDIMNFPEDQDLNTPHGILTVVFCTELGPSTPQQIDLKNLEFIGSGESPEDFRFDKFKERREWEKPNFSYQLLFGLERFLLALVETVNNMDEQTWTEIGKTSANFKPFKGEACCGADGKIILDILDNHGFYSELHKNFSKVNLAELNESFTKKIKNRSSKDLTDNQSFQLENGLYILHETLGVQDAETWDSQYNKGVVGILLIHDEHKFVASVDVSPKLYWSEKIGNFTSEQYRKRAYALGDYDSENNCSRLNSPEFPAAYYCHTYKKGGRKWRLGSLGEMSLLMVRYRRDFDRILEKVGAVNLKERAKTNCINWYWTSTEYSKSKAWTFYLDNRILAFGAVERYKTEDTFLVIPISTFEYDNLGESFTHRVSRKRSSDLVSDIDYPDGVYILHETLGVRTINEWNPEDNDGVVGVLVVEDDHKIVVALEDAPENLHWSKNYGLFNQSVEDTENAESDFNGEQHCLKFNSLIFPAAYYCLHYKKGGREWYLPSSGELWLIYRYLDEIQTALSVVGGQKLITTWDDGTPLYWSSTENSATNTWLLYLSGGYLKGYGTKVGGIAKVRPVSNFSKNRNLKESFTRKIRSKKNDELISKSDTAFVPDGVYILHQTLGVKDVEGWKPEDNYGAIGILLVEDDYKIVVALEDAPRRLRWSKKRKLVNEPIELEGDAASDFNGEKHCINLNSPDFPAAYYCLNYKKGGRKWYLPSSGELWMIYNHFEEIQSALEAVGGKKFVTSWFEGYPVYWSSTECSFPDDSATYACVLDLCDGYLEDGGNKIDERYKVRPVTKFGPSKSLKESFTRKIRSKKNDELISKSDTAFVPDGVYILHQTLGVKDVEGWNSENNNGVVGVLVVEDDHKIVVALEDAPKYLTWSKDRELINQPVDELEDAESDFNGEYYCRNLNSPKFPAAYYCLNYKKGGRNWYLPSSGELWMICRHLKEIQYALLIVGGQMFVTELDDDDFYVSKYWSSTENSPEDAWGMCLYEGDFEWGYKVYDGFRVRPVSKFGPSNTLKESFTKKTTTKGRNEIIDQADNLVVDYENLIKGLIKKYGFSTIHKYVLSLSRGVGYKEPPYVRRHEPFTEDKMVTILGELEFDKSETSDNDITVTWRRAKKFHYRTPIEKTEKFSELPVDEKRDIYKYLINWLNVRIDEDEKIEKMDKLPQPSRNVV